jgi:hypothetical protein
MFKDFYSSWLSFSSRYLLYPTEVRDKLLSTPWKSRVYHRGGNHRYEKRS